MSAVGFLQLTSFTKFTNAFHLLPAAEVLPVGGGEEMEDGGEGLPGLSK